MLQAPSSRNHPSSLPFSSGPTLSSQLVLFVTFFSSLFSFLAPHRIIIVTGIQEDNESPSGRLEAGSRNVQTKKLTFRYLHTVPASSSVQFFSFFFIFFSFSFSFASSNIAENRAKKEAQGLFHFANIYRTLEFRFFCSIVFSCNVSCRGLKIYWYTFYIFLTVIFRAVPQILEVKSWIGSSGDNELCEILRINSLDLVIEIFKFIGCYFFDFSDTIVFILICKISGI